MPYLLIRTEWQYTALKCPHGEGRRVDEIAGFFGVNELLVRRVLALAALAEPIHVCAAFKIKPTGAH